MLCVFEHDDILRLCPASNRNVCVCVQAAGVASALSVELHTQPRVLGAAKLQAALPTNFTSSLLASILA